MKKTILKLIRWLNNDRASKKILWSAIVLSTCTVFFTLVYKYTHFGYNAIDLGIYGQVFFNTAQGNLFEFTIHPHLYLGDHFELFILFLTPFFMIFKSPLTLLFFQAAAVALTAWPLYLIVRRWLNPRWALALSIAFLINPFVLNLTFFEFHILVFVLPLITFAFYFYHTKRFTPFVIFLLLSLTIREDVAFVVIMFGILALVERRSLRWILTPIVAGSLWFITALQLTGYFNTSGSSKFLSFYVWLGDSPGAIIKNFFIKPHLVLKQVVSLNNILLSIGLLMPLVFLPLFKPRYLIPILLTAAQLFLTSVSSVVVLQSHYAAIILPFLFIAAAAAIASIKTNEQKTGKLLTAIANHKPIMYIVLTTAVLYSFVTFSPLIGSVDALTTSSAVTDYTALQHDFIEKIDQNERIVSSFSYLPHLSQRSELYSLHYAFLGKKQFSDESYEIPNDVDTLLINFNDFIIYTIQSKNISSYSEQYSTGSERIVNIIAEGNFGIEQIADDIALYRRNYQSDVELYNAAEQLPADAHRMTKVSDDPLHLLGTVTIESDVPDAYQIVPIALYWHVNETLKHDYQIELAVHDKHDTVVYTKLYQLGYGLYPTSSWNVEDTVKTNHWFLIPNEYTLSEHRLTVQLIRVNGHMGLNGMRSASISISERENVSEPYELSY